MFQAFNILRYEVGQKYNSHYDAFSAAEYGPQKSQRVRLKQIIVVFFAINCILMKDFVALCNSPVHWCTLYTHSIAMY